MNNYTKNKNMYYLVYGFMQLHSQGYGVWHFLGLAYGVTESNNIVCKYSNEYDTIRVLKLDPDQYGAEFL